MKSTVYDSKAWETRNLAQLYRSVGWSLNRKHIISFISILEPQSMLDIGCLEGTYIKKLRELGYAGKYAGVDVTLAHIALAKENVKGEVFQQGDARALTFKDRAFDVVLFSDVIQHLDDQRTALAEACRVSSKYVVLSTYGTPVKSFTRHSAKFLNTFSTRQDILDLLPKEFSEVAFADLPHPTVPEDRSRRIYHFIFERVK